MEVTDNGDGTLSTAVKVDGEEITAEENGSYSVGTFKNHYEATGSVTFGGTKKLKGRDHTYQAFTFALYTTDDTFEIAEGAAATDTKSVTGAGDFTFKEISYDSDIKGAGADTYYYVIKETSANGNGWTMDKSEYHITVVVTDAGDGTFKIDVSCEDAEGETVTLTQVEDGSCSFTGLDFTNEYKAAPTSVQFTGEKYITNSLSTEKMFTFELYATDESFSIDDLLPEQKSTSGEITSSGQEFRFEPIVYDEPGTWYYVMKEQAPDEAEGWTIDGTVYYITVEVTDNGLGQLIAAVAKDDGTENGTVDGTDGVYGGFDFVNGYAASGEVILGVVKSIEGVASTDETFSFTLYGSDEKFAIVKEIETIETDGSITNSTELNFTAIPYKHDSSNTYPMYDYYVIKETGKAPDGWTLDEKEYHVTVTVEDDGTGTLTTASYIYTDKDGEPHEVNDAHFVNIYSAAGSLSLTGTKELVGGALSTDAFKFTMEDSTGASVGDVTMDEDGVITFPTLTYDERDIGKEYTYFITETNTEDPSLTLTGSGDTASFGSITYEHLGTYYYKITETAGSEENILYDTSVHYIKVVVSSDTGTHIETVEEWESVADAETADYKNLDYTEAEAGIITAVFTNTYLEELTIEKEVSGSSDTDEYEFEITLTNPDGTPFEGEVSVTSGKEETGGLSAWFSGVLRAFASDSTVTFESGSAKVTIKADEKVTLMIPSGVICTVTEKTTGADTTTVYDGDGNVIVQAKGTRTEAEAKLGTIADSTQVKFVNSYRGYFPIDEEIVPDYTDRSTWGKKEAVNEYNAIEIEMSTFLPVITGHDLENGEFTMNFHEVLDHELVLDEADADFMVFIGGVQVDHKYYTITTPSSEASPAAIRPFSAEDENALSDGCTFHVDVDLTALYEDGVITEEELQGDTEIIIFFFADLEGTGLNGSYKSTVWYDIYDGDEWLYTSNEDVVYVYTYEIDIVKYDASTLDGKNYEGSALAGATLGVYNDKDCEDPVSRNGEAYTATSDEDGRAVFYGLADGTYYVKEIEAPEGYVLSEEVLTVTLGSGLENNTYIGVYANTPEQEPETETETETEIPGTGPESPETETETESEIPQTEPDTTPRDPVKSVDAGSGKTVSVGQELTYTVTYYNHNTEPAAVTVTDRLDTGLEFVSASDDGVYDEQTRTISWTIDGAAPVTEGCVTFKAKVLESALETGSVENVATVRIGNDDAVPTNLVSNPTSESVKTGDNTPLGPVTGLMALSLALLTATVAYRRRRKAA